MLNQKDTGKLPTTQRSALCVLITTGKVAGGCCDVEDSGYRWPNAVGVDRGLLRKIVRAEIGDSR
jgi:hypothetical protein